METVKKPNKTITVLITILLFIATMPLYAQYAGSQYLSVGTGTVIYDNTPGRMSFTSAPSPQLNAHIGYGYLLTNKFTLDAELSFRPLVNEIVLSYTYAIKPQVFYSFLSNKRFKSSLGAGAVGGYQYLTAAQANSILKPDIDLWVYGFSITPRAEYLLNKKTSLYFDYSFEMQFNSIRQYNHLLNIGSKFYF